MHKFLQGAGAVGAALFASFAITVVGQGVWGVMAMANVALTPAIPWAVAVMPVVLFALAAFLAGRGWPRAGAAARRALVPLAPVSRAGWTWSLVAGGASVVALAALWTVMASLVRVPPNLLPDTRGLPLRTVLPMLLVGIVAAPLTEELAFRGYAMGLLRRHFGPVAVIVLSSVMFAAAHLTQGLYAPKLVVYLLFGLGLATVVQRTGSLLPAMAVHSLGDLTFFTLVWPFDAHRRLVTETGLSGGFVLDVAILAIAAPLCLLAFRQLLKVTGPARPATPAPSVVSALAAV
jgi:membrane protease YdiL (CAAX protease family)